MLDFRDYPARPQPLSTRHMRRALSPLALVAATALLPSFLFPAAPLTSPATPGLAQEATSTHQQALPDEGELLAWVVETAVREVEAGALTTAAATLHAAISRPWWSEQNQAHLDLALATCLLEASQQARENDDDELCRSALARASVVIERSSLPLAFESEAAKIRLAVHSLGGDQLLAATAVAQIERLNPDLAQREVGYQGVINVILVGAKLLAIYFKTKPYVEKAIASWEADDRSEALKCSFLALVEAASLREPVKGSARYGGALFRRISASLKTD